MARKSKLFAGRLRRPLDTRTMAEMLAGPGNDTRQWISYATVDPGGEDAEVVRFDPDYGYLVECTLQPSKVQVTARVGSFVAGNGEAAYFPFVSGDEVLIALPGGHERGEAVIVARLNNSIDKFPESSVAGSDPTKNAFAFMRTRSPFVQETAGPLLLRDAQTGALLAFDSGGTVTLRDGSSNTLQLSSSVIGIQTGDGNYLLQLDIANGRFTLKVDDSILTLSRSLTFPNNASGVTVNGRFTVSALAAPPVEHVLTTEALVGFLMALLPLVLAIPPPMMPVVTPADLIPRLVTALGQAKVAPLDPVLATTLFGLFAAPIPKPPPVPGQGQLMPGLGCSGFTAG
jgi:hypothetical protein